MTDSSFRQAYAVLRQHAEHLRGQSEPDIDNLLKIVNESLDAYRICKARIDAVEGALHAALENFSSEEHPTFARDQNHEAQRDLNT